MHCFLAFQLIRESPRKTQNPVTDRRVSGQPAQSESLKAFNTGVVAEGKKNQGRECPLYSEARDEQPANAKLSDRQEID